MDAEQVLRGRGFGNMRVFRTGQSVPDKLVMDAFVLPRVKGMQIFKAVEPEKGLLRMDNLRRNCLAAGLRRFRPV
jgi:hypothetical protein